MKSLLVRYPAMHLFVIVATIHLAAVQIIYLLERQKKTQPTCLTKAEEKNLVVIVTITQRRYLILFEVK